MQNLIHVPGHPARKLGLNMPVAKPHISFEHMREKLGIEVPTKPVNFDFLSSFPAQSGALGNDRLGNCAFAGIYHGIQVAVWANKKKLISPDALLPLAIDFYEKCGGYDPNAALDANGENPTDAGGDPIAIEKWLELNGLPLPSDPVLDASETEDSFAFCFDIPSLDMADISYVASQCFGVGLGVIVSDKIMLSDGTIAPVWPSSGTALGGHYIWEGATDKVISWGEKYGLSPEFMTPFNGTDLSAGNLMMATGYIHSIMFSGGKTVMGKTQDELRAFVDEYAEEVTQATPDSN